LLIGRISALEMQKFRAPECVIVADFALPESPKLISRKIWGIEKSCNFHTVALIIDITRDYVKNNFLNNNFFFLVCSGDATNVSRIAQISFPKFTIFQNHHFSLRTVPWKDLQLESWSTEKSIRIFGTWTHWNWRGHSFQSVLRIPTSFVQLRQRNQEKRFANFGLIETFSESNFLSSNFLSLFLTNFSFLSFFSLSLISFYLKELIPTWCQQLEVLFIFWYVYSKILTVNWYNIWSNPKVTLQTNKDLWKPLKTLPKICQWPENAFIEFSSGRTLKSLW